MIEGTKRIKHIKHLILLTMYHWWKNSPENKLWLKYETLYDYIKNIDPSLDILTIHILQKYIKELRNNKYVVYANASKVQGGFNGSGYFITAKGIDYVDKNLSDICYFCRYHSVDECMKRAKFSDKMDFTYPSNSACFMFKRR